MKITRDHWSSPRMFTLAAIGFVIGLKNIWLFPHHLVLYGGSAFLVVYLAFLVLIGLPLFLTQILLGRMVRNAGPVHGMAVLARRVHAPRPWQWLGAAAVLGGFLVWSYFNVVGGWLLAYAARAASGALDGVTADAAASVFTVLVRDPEKQLFWHSLFVVATLLVLTPGVRFGLERVTRVVVPAVLLMLLLLVGYAAASGSFGPALEYFLRVDFTRVGSDGVLVAIGDVFFSLGLGVGTLIAYGAYLPPAAPIVRSAVLVVVADLAVGVLAGLAVFPVLFAGSGLSAAGPELVFQSLAVAYDSLRLGAVMRVVLFVMLALVAWLSTIGLAEPAVAWLAERRNVSRARAALWVGLSSWLLGVVAILSLHPWAFSFSVFGVMRSLGFFDVLVVLTSWVLLPLVGIGCALFAGWWLRPEATRDALAMASPCLHDAWLWLNRLIIPALLVALLFGIHLFL